MFRFIPLAVVVGVLVPAVGCKSRQVTSGPDVFGEAKPGLLVGPDAIGQAPPPVELPAKETARVCILTAQNYEKEGRVEEAIKLYEKAGVTDPATAANANRRLAALYDKAGDFSKSAAIYELLVKANPKDAELLNDLGYSHYSRGDWANAAAVLAQAVQADPKLKKAWVNLGLAQAQLGQFDASFQSFCSAVRPADAHCNIAFVLAAQGKTEEAKGQYRQALQLDPGSRLAQAALAQLERPAGTQPPAAKKERFDPVAAAATVPSFAEIEARLKAAETTRPVVVPGPAGTPTNPQ